MSVGEGGMSFKAAPITTKDMFPSRHVAATPLTGEAFCVMAVRLLLVFKTCSRSGVGVVG